MLIFIKFILNSLTGFQKLVKITVINLAMIRRVAYRMLSQRARMLRKGRDMIGE